MAALVLEPVEHCGTACSPLARTEVGAKVTGRDAFAAP